jgi:hypothetical protein
MTKADLKEWAKWPYDEDDQDASWEWNEIFAQADRPGARIECFALYVDAQLNGLLSLDLQGNHTSEGPGLVVDFLATLPSNRRGNRGFKDIGKVFLGLSVYRSREMGWEGRLWLESLSEVESLYEHVGFTRLPGRSKEGNAMFELGRAGADKILSGVREAKTLIVSARGSTRTRH